MNDHDHAKRLIADLANAMQACVGSMPDMDRDELRALAERLTTMTRIVLRALNAPEPTGTTWPHAGSAAFPPPYTCEYGDSPHACRARATQVIEWRTHQGNVRTYLCDEHHPIVRASMRGT